MASCVRNIFTKNYQNLVIGFQVTVKNVGDVFLRHGVVTTAGNIFCDVIMLNSALWWLCSLLRETQWCGLNYAFIVVTFLLVFGPLKSCAA